MLKLCCFPFFPFFPFFRFFSGKLNIFFPFSGKKKNSEKNGMSILHGAFFMAKSFRGLKLHKFFKVVFESEDIS